MELKLPIADLEVLLGESVADMDAAQLEAKMRNFYGFLPDSATVRVEDGNVILTWGEVPTSSKAERLVPKAAPRQTVSVHRPECS